MPYLVDPGPLPDNPATVLVAVDHVGLRFNLTRTLLGGGLFATLVRAGDSVGRLIGEIPPLRTAPVAVIAQCGSAEGVRRLLARIRELRWDPRAVYLVRTPLCARAEARRAGAVILDDEVGSEELKREILQNAA